MGNSASAPVSPCPGGKRAYDICNTVDAVRHSPHAFDHVDLRAAKTLVNDLVANLSDGQRDCLRLVFGHMTSKDIARALDISPHTVDMRLRTAMRTLGVASRIEAARLLIDSEGGATLYQPLIYQPSDIANGSGTVSIGGPASTGADELADQQFSARPNPDFGPPAGGPPRPAGASRDLDVAKYLETGRESSAGLSDTLPWGRRNTLSPGVRLAWIAGIAIGSALGFGAIVGALEALKNLL